jgi:hypothetical protein
MTYKPHASTASVCPDLVDTPSAHRRQIGAITRYILWWRHKKIRRPKRQIHIIAWTLSKITTAMGLNGYDTARTAVSSKTWLVLVTWHISAVRIGTHHVPSEKQQPSYASHVHVRSARRSADRPPHDGPATYATAQRYSATTWAPLSFHSRMEKLQAR